MAEADEQQLFTEACLHGLRAKLCDDLGSLDRFPPQVAAMARKVADALEVSGAGHDLTPESHLRWTARLQKAGPRRL